MYKAGATGFAVSIANYYANQYFGYAGVAAVGCASYASSGSNCRRGAYAAIVQKFVNDNTSNWGFYSRFAATTIAGGASSVLTGGKFADGAKTGAFLQMLSEASIYYEESTGYKASAAPGENRAVNTFEPDEITGRQKPEDRGMNVTGLNEKEGFFRQGGPLSEALNVVPGINATSGLHDYWFNQPNGPSFSMFNNIGTMIPAAAISLGAIFGNYMRDWMSNPMSYQYFNLPRKRQ
jgi:hypothetical protein